MLFLYENQNRRSKFPVNFSFPYLRRIKTCDFTSGGILNTAQGAGETEDSVAVTSI